MPNDFYTRLGNGLDTGTSNPAPSAVGNFWANNAHKTGFSADNAQETDMLLKGDPHYLTDAKICIEIKTGDNTIIDGNQGKIELFIDVGDGFNELENPFKTSDNFYDTNAIVYQGCIPYGAKLGIKAVASNEDSWQGSVKASFRGSDFKRK